MQGQSAMQQDIDGRTPLHYAVLYNQLSTVDMLLKFGGPDLLLVRDALGCTPVHLAAAQNQVTLIDRLVKALLADTKGTAPLHEAARLGCMQVYSYLSRRHAM